VGRAHCSPCFPTDSPPAAAAWRESWVRPTTVCLFSTPQCAAPSLHLRHWGGDAGRATVPAVRRHPAVHSAAPIYTPSCDSAHTGGATPRLVLPYSDSEPVNPRRD